MLAYPSILQTLQDAFQTLPSTYGLFTTSPLYSLVSVQGHVILIISVALAKDEHQVGLVIHVVCMCGRGS